MFIILFYCNLTFPASLFVLLVNHSLIKRYSNFSLLVGRSFALKMNERERTLPNQIEISNMCSAGTADIVMITAGVTTSGTALTVA